MSLSRPTHQQIADAVGVSRVAVSQVLHKSQKARISPEKQREIERVAQAMGYVPRNLTTHNIGFVGRADSLHLSGENRLLMMVDNALRAAGYRLLLTSVEYDEPANLTELLNSKTVDGVLFTRWFDGRIEGLLPPDIPWLVMADEDVVPETADKVVMDTASTAGRMVRHMASFGHQRFGVVSSRGMGGVTTHIKVGAQHALRQAGLPDNITAIEVIRDREIPPFLLEIMAAPNAPTAWIIFGAEKVVTVQAALLASGYRIPEDVSLMCLLDSHMLEALSPAVSATTAMGQELAEAAVSRILEKINDPDSAPRHILLPGEIVPRDSVGPAPSNSLTRGKNSL